MNKVSKIIFILVFAVLLVLPTLQMIFVFITPIRPFNVSIPKQPKLSYSDFMSGNFQRKFETWVLRGNKLWGYLVKTDNQLNFSVFKQIGSRYGSEMHLGNDNYLYQLLYIKDINRQTRKPIPAIRRKVTLIKKVQDFLKDHNKALLIIISQSKLSHKPEIVPRAQRSFSFNDPERNVHIIRQLFDELGVNYIDTGKLFSNNQEKFNLPFYNKGGSHWTQPGACLVAKALTENIQRQIERKVNSFDCLPVVSYPHSPLKNDADLSRAINIWNMPKTFGATPYIESQALVTNAWQPSVLIVGTSFMWSVRDFLERYNFYNKHDFYFYNRTNNFYRVEGDGRRIRGKNTIDRNNHDWDRIMSHDAIVLEASEALSAAMGFKFLEKFQEKFL